MAKRPVATIILVFTTLAIGLCRPLFGQDQAQGSDEKPVLMAQADLGFGAFEFSEEEYPPAPSLEELAAVEPLEEALKVGDLPLTPSGIYEKAPAEVEKTPLTPRRKFRLAMVNTSDPFNVFTLASGAGFDTFLSRRNSDYGTGGMAFAKRFGTGMTDELSGEFFQTFLFPAIFRQDPHYHRDVDHKIPSRVVYALTQVLVTRSDSGHKMFNYGEVLGNFASASVGNIYHVDRDTGFGPTTARIGVSIASDAVWNLFTEFWPDVTKHMNLRLVFLQRLAERAAEQN